MASTTLCARCGQTICGSGRKIYGKVYCARCYEVEIENVQKLEADKQRLNEYVCKLFLLEDIPSSFLYTIDKALKEGKKIPGIRGTIYYYFEILGHPANSNSVNYLDYIIKTEYENAKKYFSEQAQIKQNNAKVNLNIEPIQIQIDPKKLREQTGSSNKIKYKIEDL